MRIVLKLSVKWHEMRFMQIILSARIEKFKL